MKKSSIHSWQKTILKVLLALGLAAGVLVSQAQERRMVLSGDIVSPAYEGWWPNDDGTYTLFFGYMNSNWEQEFNIPVGSKNYFRIVEPGELDDLERNGYESASADMGQPTHFYPRRNPFLFTIDVPEDFGEREVVWTLETQDHVARAYGSVYADYRIDPQVISTEVGGNFGSLDDRLRDNIPPELEVEGDAYRTVRVGEALNLEVYANDPDNLPARRDRSPPSTPEQIYNPPSSIVAMSGPGLRFSWIVYRGPAAAADFEPTQMKTYTDTRVYANSPWSPPFIIPKPPDNNRWRSTVRFDQPGEYVLRGVASDGSLFSYRNINVTVTR